jgi:MFS transporter, DHA3 family, multidrug efflux protein
VLVFRRLLVNALLGSVTGSFLWFAVTFWAYLETRSVLVTSVISGFFGIAQAAFGLLFGTYVDRHRKHRAMVVSATATAACFAAATALYLAIDHEDMVRLRNPWLWVLIALIMTGSVVGNLRGIALATCVTLLVPEEGRDRANGMVGTVTGVAFAITSVFSGLVVGRLGMGWALGISATLTAASLVHLLMIRFDEPDPEPVDPAAPRARAFDLSGALDAIRAVPGLMALIAFASFNNLIGGVYMSLLDPYGLSLVSVETWGLLWGFISLGFIAGGLIVARRGLGPRPMRLLIAGNAVNWLVASVFSFRSSIAALTIGMALWLTIIPIIEACEQTVLQRTVPFERQGRVFGFAQSVESAASPIVALSMGPIAQELAIPFMTDGAGADLIGDWFGVGLDRGLALCFTVAGLVGLVVTAVAVGSRSFRLLDRASRHASDVPVAA